MPIFSRKKPDEKPKEQAKKPDELANISEKVELQVTSQSPSLVRKDETAAVRKAMEGKANAVIKNLDSVQRSLVKALVAIRKHGPGELTNDSFKGELAVEEMLDFAETAYKNLSGMTNMEGHLLSRLARGKEPAVVDKYRNSIAGLNAKVNKIFSTVLEQDPKKISTH